VPYPWAVSIDPSSGAVPIPQIRTPEKWTAGAYANGIGVWYTQTEFTLDFFVNLPPEVGTDPDGNQVVLAPQQVVARLKLPPSLIFQLMRNLSTNMDQYEQQHGSIPDFTRAPTDPGASPEI
jgi:hypothetical protein